MMEKFENNAKKLLVEDAYTYFTVPFYFDEKSTEGNVNTDSFWKHTPYCEEKAASDDAVELMYPHVLRYLRDCDTGTPDGGDHLVRYVIDRDSSFYKDFLRGFLRKEHKAEFPAVERKGEKVSLCFKFEGSEELFGAPQIFLSEKSGTGVLIFKVMMSESGKKQLKERGRRYTTADLKLLNPSFTLKIFFWCFLMVFDE